MNFCPKCDSKLIIDKEVTDNKPKLKLVCYVCDNSLSKGSVKIKEKISEGKPSIKILDKTSKQLQSLPTTSASCHKCDGNTAYFWEQQTADLEQASTQFFRCTKCNHTWRSN